ncbi:MAG: SRPBCC family protein [Sphingomicrobium sp.]
MSDRIERSIFIAAPLDKVWAAISDYREFGSWFGVMLDQPFVAGQSSTGHMSFNDRKFDWNADVVAVEPPKRLAFRWRPFAIDPDVDYSAEPKTLVEFTLAEQDGGTELTVVESGFNAIPASRRDEAFRMNSKGWSAQVENVRRHAEA